MYKRTIRPTMAYSMISKLPALLWLLPALLIMNFIPDEPGYLKYVPVGLAVLWYLYRVALVRSKRYTIGEEQLIYRRGIFSSATDYLELYRVKDYRVDRPFLLRLINTMKITLVTSDRTDGRINMNGIPNSRVVRGLRELVEINRREKRVYEVD